MRGLARSVRILVALLALACAVGPATAERLVRMDVAIEVEPDSGLRVVEEIVYDYEGAHKHAYRAARSRFRDAMKNTLKEEGYLDASGGFGQLARELKQKCGSGGTIRDDVVEIQGDHRDALADELSARGYTVKKSGG